MLWTKREFVLFSMIFSRLVNCLHPNFLFKRGFHPSGKPKYSRYPSPADVDPVGIPVPCGKCIACLYNRRRQWQDRLIAESWLHDYNSFVTLTYNDDHLPSCSPDKTDLQLFLKRFRNLVRFHDVRFDNFRYFLTLEFGELNYRPHYHGVFFGVNLLDDVFEPRIVGISNGRPVYSSALLESVWQNGFVCVDNTSAAVMRYVTKYTLKQSTDSSLWSIYSRGLGLSNFIVDDCLTPFGLQSCDNGFYQVGDCFNARKTSLPRSLVRKLETLDPVRYSVYKDRIRRFGTSSKTDSRSSAELESVLNWRNHTENTRRKLDNAT